MANFIDLKDLSKDQLLDLISLSLKWKNEPHTKFMQDKHVVLIFEKPSLGTTETTCRPREAPWPQPLTPLPRHTSACKK